MGLAEAIQDSIEFKQKLMDEKKKIRIEFLDFKSKLQSSEREKKKKDALELKMAKANRKIKRKQELLDLKNKIALSEKASKHVSEWIIGKE